MKPLFYMLLVTGKEGDYEFAGAFQSREKAEARAARLNKPCRIEAASRHDLKEGPYA